MKKIVFVIGIMGKGGAERVVAAIANELVKMKIRVRIITLYGNRQDYKLNERIELVPVFCKCKVRAVRPLERIKILRTVIKEFNPDCIISFLADVNIHTILANTRNRIPLIVSERNDPKQDPEKKWQRKLRDILYKKADGYVFQTEEAKQYFEKIIYRKDCFAIIPNPITPDLPYHKQIDNKRLITACRLNKQKNIPLMIDAVGDLIEEGFLCKLDIFGDGVLYDELKGYIEQKHLEKYVFLKGFTHDIYRQMAESVAFIITSNYEGISNSMLEALAIGIPVISTDCPVGGARMFIKDGKNGFLVPVGNKECVKEKIKWVLNNPKQAEILGQNAICIRKQLDINVITNQWFNFILQIVERK